MRQMKPASAKALTWFPAILLIAAVIVMSPSGAFFLAAAAALIAVFPSVFSQGKVRLVAAVLLLVSLGLALEKYPDFKHDQAAYRRHHANPPQPTQSSE
jgi:hypothetical protein